MVFAAFSQPLFASDDSSTTNSGVSIIDAEQLIELYDKYSNLVIIDSRKTVGYEKGFIEGAINLPDTKTSPSTLSSLAKDKSTPIVFYCNGVKCGRSETAAKIAQKAGYKNIYWFRGGWEEWIAKGYPMSK